MTVNELNLEFDILYDNIASNAAPGIDKYEKSVYLTKAQLEIVKEYNGPQNKYQKSFDGSDKRRADLKELIRDYKSTVSSVNAENISSDSKFFKIPTDVFLIKFEKGIYTSNNCTKEIDIIPITLDDFNKKKDNPFRKPYKKLAWRIDYKTDTDPVVEIVSSENISTYQLRYIKYPEPIILTDLTAGEFTGMNLSIDGVTSPQTCKLNQEIHREILDRAVELATRDYRENSLQNKVQLNNRNN